MLMLCERRLPTLDIDEDYDLQASYLDSALIITGLWHTWSTVWRQQFRSKVASMRVKGAVWMLPAFCAVCLF